MAVPIPYRSELETAAEDEAEISQDLNETLRKIAEKTYADSGHGMRGVHVKSHGLLTGQFEVLPGLPDTLAQGLFAKPGTYPVVMRFSSTPGDVLPDSVSTPRGLAIKIVGVQGDRLPGSEGDVTQDFVMVNGPAFNSPNAKAFLGGLKLLAPTTDKMEGAKVVLSKVLQGTEQVIETFGNPNTTVRGLGGEPPTHPLGETYYSQTPLLYGHYMAKVSLAPATPELVELKGQKIDIDHNKTALREALIDHFAIHSGEWDVRVQLCTNLDTMPIEDASKTWPEEESPFITVARITVKPQMAWNEEKSKAIDDGMSFTPWHGLAAHRPLGSINRLRKSAYEASSQFRAARNGIALQEPRDIDALIEEDTLIPAS